MDQDQDQDSFSRLPSVIAIDIFSRLPVKSVARCKCVSRQWRNHLRTPEFFNSHILKSAQPEGLAVFQIDQTLKAYKMVEFGDSMSDLGRWNVAGSFKLPFDGPVLSSAKGLLFLFDDLKNYRTEFVISNPISNQCVMVKNPRMRSSTFTQVDVLGFGVSSSSGEYKIVRIFLHKQVPVAPEFRYDNWQCQVYTVGSGRWREICCAGAGAAPLLYTPDKMGACLRGRLHWFALEFPCLEARISCFNLETETFTSFAPPNLKRPHSLCCLKEQLCIGDNSCKRTSKMDIWLMKSYGDENSWMKAFSITQIPAQDYGLKSLSPLKVFEDGDILLGSNNKKLLYYSAKIKAVVQVHLIPGLEEEAFIFGITSYAPSFLRLDKFSKAETVISFTASRF